MQVTRKQKLEKNHNVQALFGLMFHNQPFLRVQYMILCYLHHPVPLEYLTLQQGRIKQTLKIIS